MSNNARLYHLSHCTYVCQYHVVWTTRYRGKVLQDKYTKAELKRILGQIAQWKHLSIIAWHIGDEHIHLYLIIPPKYSVSYILNVLKGKSSAWLKKKTSKFPKGSLWSRGYFVSTIGLNEAVIKRYIEHQRHDQVPLPTLF